MSGETRLGAGWGLLIDRRRALSFSFDGTTYLGFEGDVIASALLAGGRMVMSRSFKYHRPRGPLTMAGHDVNSLVQVGVEPNVRGDRHRISANMAVTSINRVGPLDRDWLAVIGLFSRFLPVGFYYKTFFRPRGAWAFFEKPIRALAGLGRLDPRAHHAYFDKSYLFCDTLVVGGGPAGLEAAIAAAESGADTLLIEEWPQVGGSLLFGRVNGSREEAVARRATLLTRAAALPNLRLMTDTVVSGLFADHWASAIQGNRLYKIRARQTVLATGAYDQPLVFKNNDLPGIMFSDAAQRLMRLYGVAPGKRVVIAAANRFGFDTALDLLDAGVEVAAVVDMRQGATNDETAPLVSRGVRILKSHGLQAARGKRRVEAVALLRDEAGRMAPEWIACDTLLMSVGYTPALNLACHTGARAVYDPRIAMHRAVGLPAGLSLAGAVAGIWADDLIAPHAAAIGRGETEAATDSTAATITHPWPMPDTTEAQTKNFVDFDEDLVADDIVWSVEDGYDNIQLVKRYSTAGLGSSQGRHANLNTIRLVARATGRSIEAVGTTTFRPPLVPEKFGHLAGRGFEPTRLSTMHRRHIELGAQMVTVGLWLRPAYYGTKQTAAAAIASEVRAVREAVGMIDVSTLGGLEIRGADAAAFMERIYTSAFAKQPLGRARYALMTDETGVIIDDGVACRLHERHFYVTATTAAVDQVYRLMTFWNQHWQMDVDIANVTSGYAVLNVAGPQSRAVLRTLDTDIDLSAEAFPFMAVRVGHIAGVPVRVLRVGFVGELAYEIHCPATMGEALWDQIATAGAPLGIQPFGLEAQRILRLEKGHIIIGQDTDGLTNPLEADMAWALSKTKPFYIGKRAIDIQAAKGIARKLVGFLTPNPAAPAPKECHLVIAGGQVAGRVTSVTYSPTLSKVIGLAYVPAATSTIGTRFEIRVDGGRMIEAEIADLPFYDPAHTRQEM